MTLREADKLHWVLSNIEWVCYLLQLLQEQGEQPTIDGYEAAVVQDCRWYLLQRQHELVDTMRQTLERLYAGEQM